MELPASMRLAPLGLQGQPLGLPEQPLQERQVLPEQQPQELLQLERSEPLAQPRLGSRLLAQLEQQPQGPLRQVRQVQP